MEFKQSLSLLTSVSVATTIAAMVGLPLVTAMSHGLNPTTWPAEAIRPPDWLGTIAALNAPAIMAAYSAMAEGSAAAFAGGGKAQFWGLLASCAVPPILQVLTTKSIRDENRDHTGQLGNARWANASEKGRMSRGLEIGLDPDSKKPIRIALESNALTIAPPRSGKTSGLIVPNLLGVDDNAWLGAAVVIDVKGEVFAATGYRRQQLGRKVARFDLRRGARHGDFWNPLQGIAVNNVERLLAMARVLVVEGGTQNAYFSDRAVDFLAGTMAAELLDASRGSRPPTMQNVARLMSSPDELLALAETGNSQILRSLCGDLRLDDRSRDQIISTAKTAVAWLHDERFGALTSRSTFSMADVVAGRRDLFVIVPPNSMRLLAPLLRLLLADLMSRALTDRKPGDDRLLVLIDEAAALGRFPELEKAIGLLPGLGLSFWTHWQSRHQGAALYGPEFQVFLDTAEVITVSDFSSFGSDADDFSKALGNFTAFVEGTSDQQSASGKSSSKNRVKHAVPLMTPEALRTMPADEMIVLLNSKRYSRHPLRLRKLRYFEDKRFDGLYRHVKPTGAL